MSVASGVAARQTPRPGWHCNWQAWSVSLVQPWSTSGTRHKSIRSSSMAVQLGVAGIVLLPPALLAEDVLHVRLDLPLIGAFLYLVFVISIGASLLWFWLLSRGEASVASAYYFLTPIFGLGLAALLLGEQFGPRDVIGLLAVALGIALINRPTRPTGELLVEAGAVHGEGNREQADAQQATQGR